MQTLLPNLLRTAESRLVFMTSDLHRMVPNDTKFENLDEINRDIGPTYLYNRSKLAEILIARLLDQKLRQGDYGKGLRVYVNATHPGAVSTDQPKQAEDAYGFFASMAVAVLRPLMKDPIKQGCRSALYAATSPEIIENDISGAYVRYHKVRIIKKMTQVLRHVDCT